MLGEDDHNEVDNEPLNAADLFGDDFDEIENNDGENGENATENDGDAEQASATAEPQLTARKKYRQVNRLANLNDVWLVDPKKENIGKVNSYFEKIKFRKGKGQERENLKLILQRYEYYGQQCYPKLCFKDFVEKVEHVSSKRSIKHALQKIRRGDLDADETQSDTADGNDFGIDMDINNDDFGTNDEPPAAPPPFEDYEDKEVTPPPSPKPVSMTDEMREMIRKKREEALAKRKQRFDDSVNVSQSVDLQHDDSENGKSGSQEGKSGSLEGESPTKKTQQSDDKNEMDHDNHDSIKELSQNASQLDTKELNSTNSVKDPAPELDEENKENASAYMEKQDVLGSNTELSCDTGQTHAENVMSEVNKNSKGQEKIKSDELSNLKPHDANDSGLENNEMEVDV